MKIQELNEQEIEQVAGGTSATRVNPESGAQDLTAGQTQATARRCRWVWRHGLVCDTPLGTVNP
jgi:hypothetical protein